MASIRVRVVPRSTRPGVGSVDDAVVVRVRAPAVDGRATEEARRALAAALAVPASAVALRHGRRSRDKMFDVDGLTGSEVRQRLRGGPAPQP